MQIRLGTARGVGSSGDAKGLLDPDTNLTLKIHSLSLSGSPVLEQQFTSRDYGEMSESFSVCWRFSGQPQKLMWEISRKDAKTM